MKSVRLSFEHLGSPLADDADRATIEIAGFAVTPVPAPVASHFILTAEPVCCPGCMPRDTAASVEVFAASPIPLRGRSMRLSGTWRVRRDVTEGWRYQLHGARPVEPSGWSAVTRRGVLTSGPLMCVAACATANTPATAARRQADARAAIEAAPAVDIHTHAGGTGSVRRMHSGEKFDAVAQPMRQGGMAAICLAFSSDGPSIKIMPDGNIRPVRTPAPGELYAYARLAFGRMHELARDQGIKLIRTAADLRAAKAGTAAAIISVEGADFLEGRIERVDEAYHKWAMRHLQLTPRVNELGDIQTEPAEHGGLTEFGADVIRRCNKLGIVVDVAHGTFDLVKRAAEVTTRPLVLSHTSLVDNPGRYVRRISAAHARVVASTGGVIGIWPVAAFFGTLQAMAGGMARMVDVTGIDHVGLGTDMTGIVGPNVFPEYDQLPGLAEALLGVGFSVADTAKLLGGNYARVFAATVA